MGDRTRREWLRVVGTGGIVGIAGCSSSEETEPDDNGDSEDDVDSEDDGGETIPDDEETTPLQNPTQQTKLAADDGDSDDYFGISVALSSDGSTALIGAHREEDPNGSWAGSAYVFDSSGGSWTHRAKLAADDGDSDDLFGTRLALSGDGSTALIGAFGDEDPNGSSAGSAYVFE